MKVLESKIFDIINSILFVIQSKTDKIKRDSFILSHIDLLIFIGISLTLIISTFMQTEMIGVFSLIVPFLVFIKIGSDFRFAKYLSEQSFSFPIIP